MDYQSDSHQEEVEDKPFTIPKSTKELKACQNCGLLLTTSQWKENGEQCPNQCASALTKQFQGMVCLMKPLQSWVAKRLQLQSESYPGLYAINVQAD